MIRLVIMAAGKASRMGTDKLGLPWEKTNVLSHVLRTVLNAISYLQNINENNVAVQIELVVVAHQTKRAYLSPALIEEFDKTGGVWRVVNPGQPLALNIKAGMDDCLPLMTGIGFLPGDQIGVETYQLAGLLRYFSEHNPDFLVPRAGDTPGSPVIFHGKYVSELLNLTGEQGGKVILGRYPELLSSYSVDPNFLIDLDTPEDYELYKKQFNR